MNEPPIHPTPCPNHTAPTKQSRIPITNRARTCTSRERLALLARGREAERVRDRVTPCVGRVRERHVERAVGDESCTARFTELGDGDTATARAVDNLVDARCLRR